MKHQVARGIVFTLLICIFAVLGGKVTDSGDYTGIWYRSDDGERYIFESGIIQCADAGECISEKPVFSGAYSYGKDHVILFLAEESGAGEVTELQIVRRWKGDYLCEYKDGGELVWFYRNPHDLKQEK